MSEGDSRRDLKRRRIGQDDDVDATVKIHGEDNMDDDDSQDEEVDAKSLFHKKEDKRANKRPWTDAETDCLLDAVKDCWNSKCRRRACHHQ